LCKTVAPVLQKSADVLHKRWLLFCTTGRHYLHKHRLLYCTKCGQLLHKQQPLFLHNWWPLCCTKCSRCLYKMWPTFAQTVAAVLHNRQPFFAQMLAAVLYKMQPTFGEQGPPFCTTGGRFFAHMAAMAAALLKCQPCFLSRPLFASSLLPERVSGPTKDGI